MSGFPSLSVSLWTLITKSSLVVVPFSSVNVTVTGKSRSSSNVLADELLGSQLSFQSFTTGVPEIIPVSGSYVTPSGSPSTVTSASGLLVFTLTSVIGLPSTTVWSSIGSISGCTILSAANESAPVTLPLTTNWTVYVFLLSISSGTVNCAACSASASLFTSVLESSTGLSPDVSNQTISVFSPG